MNLIGQFFEKSNGRMVENRMHRVEPERIDVAIHDPVKRVLNKIIAYLVAPRTIEIERRSPRRLIPVGEIGAKLAKIISFRAEMIVNDVQNYGQAAPMAGIDEQFQIRWTAVGILRGEMDKRRRNPSFCAPGNCAIGISSIAVTPSSQK